MAKKTSTIHLRVEPDIKNDVEKLLDRLGLTTTDAINIFLNQVVLTGGLPFPVKIPQPNKETLAAIKEAEEIKRGVMKSKAKSVDEFFKEMEV
ncbi:MAG: type II toxin-antitoxin system RelB/DinJ family antitoxin [Actinobacteria bacterium]|nr:type II toxin-antitoxin system RelB/DinJ family antitoxin [Actinomycetota bacterium]